MKDGKAVCQCPQLCDPTPDRVCANDGNSYANECYMRVRACEIKNPLVVLKKGPCGELKVYAAWSYYSVRTDTSWGI